MSTAHLEVDNIIENMSSAQLQSLIERASNARAEKLIEELNPLRQEYNSIMAKITETVEPYGLTATKFLEMRGDALNRHISKYLNGETRAPNATTDSGRPKQTVPPKYRHPTDETKTWTGRGNRPRWVEELIGQGTSLESLLIVKASAEG